MVYVGSNDGYTYALNSSTGAKVWSYATGDIELSSPAVVGGVAFIGSTDNVTYALNASTGARILELHDGRAR